NGKMHRVGDHHVRGRDFRHHPRAGQLALALPDARADLRIAFGLAQLLFELSPAHPKALFVLPSLVQVVKERQDQQTNTDPKGEAKDRKSTRLNSSHVKISYAV